MNGLQTQTRRKRYSPFGKHAQRAKLGKYFLSVVVDVRVGVGHVEFQLYTTLDSCITYTYTLCVCVCVCVCVLIVLITVYVRYRQVAEYLPSAQLPHHVRLNKAALGIGIIVAFGMTLVANFPVRETLAMWTWT